MSIIQAQNRQEIRHQIGRNIGDVIIGTVTAVPGGGADTSSLIDTNRLQEFGDDDINGRQVCIYDATGSIVDGETSWVSDFDGTNKDATCAPVFSANITTGDKYEMWHVLTVEEVNDVINQAIMEVTRKCLQPKQTETAYTERDRYLYDVLSGFKGVHKVEHIYQHEGETIDDCNSAWDAATGVTVSTDDEIYRHGGNCNKFVVSDAVAAGALLATNTITEADLSNYNTIEFWIYSTTAQTAANLEFYLDDTASCASPVDTMSLPAITADTWTRVQLTMTNPELDTAIISVGIGQKAATDVGACTIWIDLVKATKTTSRVYHELSPEYWSIINNTTDYLQLTRTGKSITGDNTLLRISGYQLPALLSDDTTDSEIDPQYIINYATAYLMLYHAKSNRLEISDRRQKAEGLMGLCEKMKIRISTNIKDGTKWVE